MCISVFPKKQNENLTTIRNNLPFKLSYASLNQLPTNKFQVGINKIKSLIKTNADRILLKIVESILKANTLIVIYKVFRNIGF